MEHAQETTNVAFVPGFMQPAEAWAPVAERIAERGWPITYGRAEDAVTVGYSHGGRVALHGTHRGLVLVGATPGIEDHAEREARRRSDEELAAWMEAHTIEEIVARWEKQPIFATQSDALVEAQRPGRLAHDPRELAAQLRTTGQGVLPPVWDRLAQMTIPVLAIAGELDRKYAAIAFRMVDALPNGRVAIIPGAGHAPQLERPEEVALVLGEFLDDHFRQGVVRD